MLIVERARSLDGCKNASDITAQNALQHCHLSKGVPTIAFNFQPMKC